MKYSLIITCLVFTTLFSCKENKETDQNNPQSVEVVKEDFFKVTLDVVVKKDDNFHLYFTEDGSILFNEEKSVWTQIKGSDKPQTVVFTLSKDVLPTAIRLDLGYGVNPLQSEIEIINFNCSCSCICTYSNSRICICVISSYSRNKNSTCISSTTYL